MIEIPEAVLLAKQLQQAYGGRTITSIVAEQTHHRFAWYYGDPADYPARFTGRTVEGAYAYGGKVHLACSGDYLFLFADGTSPRYFAPGAKLPKKHQLDIGFDDGSHLVCTIRMYGNLRGYPASDVCDYDEIARIRPDVLSDAFDLAYLQSLYDPSAQKKLSAKGLIATEQRIPGLGNGCAHDILFHARIHPKRDVSSFDEEAWRSLCTSVKTTIRQMVEQGGRDVEKDLYGKPGGYQTVLSKNTYPYPCPACGGPITREAFLGGNIYYCAHCQK